MTVDRATIERLEPRAALQADAQSEAARDRPNPTLGKTAVSKGTAMRIDRIDGDFIIDATLVGELLNVPVADVPALMRDKRITCVCESGIDADQGTFRLNLFHRGRHARLRVDTAGRILRRSVIDFGERPVPRGRQRSLRASPRVAP